GIFVLYLKTLLEDYTKLIDISKIEVLINQICVPNCPMAIKEHLHIPKSDWCQFTNQEVKE
ncbi:hypothetical protein IJV79_03870, partial [bacterium]|nr:hypothetical protein [bacterium]